MNQQEQQEYQQLDATEDQLETQNTTEMFDSSIFPTRAGLIGYLFMNISTIWISCNILILSISPFTLYSAHPLGMSLFFILSVLGISTLQQAQIRTKKKLFSLHVLFQVISIIAIVIGFSAIYQNKINLFKSHFTTLHSKFGLATFISALSASFFGILLKYAPGALGGVNIAKKFYPIHKVFGYIIAAFTLYTIYLASEKPNILNGWGSELWIFNTALLLITGLFLLLRARI